MVSRPSALRRLRDTGSHHRLAQQIQQDADSTQQYQQTQIECRASCICVGAPGGAPGSISHLGSTTDQEQADHEKEHLVPLLHEPPVVIGEDPVDNVGRRVDVRATALLDDA